MLGILLSSNQTVIFNILDPGVILFVSLFVLFGAAITLVFLLKERPALSWPLMALLYIIEFALIGILALEFGGASSGFYTIGSLEILSDLFATHRWLIFQLPILLLASSIIILSVYREQLGEKHAKDYRLFVIVSVVVSFLSILVIGLESFI